MRDAGFEIYREVRVNRQWRADLVGRLGPAVWIVECKTTCSLALLAQAFQWLGRAHYVSIACPRAKVSNNEFIERMLKSAGIGWLQTTQRDPRAGDVSELVAPRMWRGAKQTQWDKILRDEHKTFSEAGAKAGGWTPFKATAAAVERAVLKAPGIGLEGLVQELKGQHHYRSDAMAVKAIPFWIRKGLIPSITIFKEGRKLRLYHTTQCLDMAPPTTIKQ